MANKLEVKVCVGSSCHIRGGTKTLRVLQSLIEEANISENVELSADLCLDNCLNAPNVVIDGKIYGGVTPELAEAFFNEHILPMVHLP